LASFSKAASLSSKKLGINLHEWKYFHIL